MYGLPQTKFMNWKDNFPMPFMDQMLDRLAGKGWYCFFDGYSGYNQISIALEDQEKTTFIFHMGPLRSNECRLGCAMHPPHFRDV